MTVRCRFILGVLFLCLCGIALPQTFAQVNSDGPLKDIRVTLQTADRLIKTNPLICFEPLEGFGTSLGRYSLWTVPCKHAHRGRRDVH